MTELRATYTESFLAGLSAYAHITATAEQAAEDPPYITISQHLTMDGSPLIVALAASPDTFYALASGYSGISLSGMGDLAVDAACELFNVINGHFSSQMARTALPSPSSTRRAMRSAALCPLRLFSHFPSHVHPVRCSSWHRAKNFFHNYCFCLS